MESDFIDALKVTEEASRCLLCHDAPCSRNCPAATDPASFIRSVRFRNFKGAAETIRNNNPFGSVCSYICPTEKYCEKACSRCKIDKPIKISEIQKFVVNFEKNSKMNITPEISDKMAGKKVAVIGAGPSGLTCAAELAKAGVKVVVYESKAEPGGMLKYAIPSFRLNGDVIKFDIKKITDLGVEIKCNAEVGTDIDFETLKSENDAVVLAVGDSEPVILPQFENNKYVETALDVLERIELGKYDTSSINSVIVIGGSDTAMDVASNLRLLGVEDVMLVARKKADKLRASQEELSIARENNVSIYDGFEIDEVKDNTVTFKHCNNSSALNLKADKIILATGEKANVEKFGIDIENDGNISNNGYHAKDNIFVTGDIAKGDKTCVYAVKKGKEAAKEILDFMK